MKLNDKIKIDGEVKYVIDYDYNAPGWDHRLILKEIRKDDELGDVWVGNHKETLERGVSVVNELNISIEEYRKLVSGIPKDDLSIALDFFLGDLGG